jgi:hypothetical protein
MDAKKQGVFANAWRNPNATKPPHESGSHERVAKEINAC